MTYTPQLFNPRRFKLLILAFLLLAATSHAEDVGTQGATAPAEPQKFRVGTKVSPPFAFKRIDGSWTGISIELWRHIATNLGIEYESYEYEIPVIIDKLEAGELDAVSTQQ